MILKKHEKLILISLFIGSIIVFTFYDLSFTKLIYNPSSSFGKFFYMFGELPSTFVGLASFAILTTSYTSNNQKAKRINILLYGCITSILGIILSFQMVKYFKFELYFALFISLIGSIILIYWSNQLSEEKKNHFRKYAFVGALTMVLGILIPNLIKIVWARPRYRIFNGDDSLFRAWYQPGGFTLDDNWKSFPSGHSAAAAVSLVYIYLPQLFDKLKGKERLIQGISMMWIVLVMFSRVILGDHFMTDTIFGSGIAIVIFITLNRIFIVNQKEIN